MYITRAISYRNAWQTLVDKYPDALTEIKHALAQITRANMSNAVPLKSLVSPSSAADLNAAWRIDSCWEKAIEVAGWQVPDKRIHFDNGRLITSLRHLGYVKGPVSVNFIRYRELLNRWLFTLAPIATKRGLVEIPVAVVMLEGVEEKLRGRRGMMGDNYAFKHAADELGALSPLSHGEPFLILGIDVQHLLEGMEIEVLELEAEAEAANSNVIINRAIEFPPEYHQAGLGILNYFGTVLREKCPDENAKVTIEQDGFTVRLIIESENGNREVIEKALQEYQMVVSGQMKPEELFNSKLRVLELKSELRIAQVRIETQQDLIEHQRLELDKLGRLVARALEKPVLNPTITVAPVININNHQTAAFEMQESLRCTAEDVRELSEFAGGEPSIELRLRDLEEALALAGRRETPDAVKKSSGLMKLKKVIDEANETGTSLNTFFNKISGGVSALQKLAHRYNDIAEWCGAPTVPRILISNDE